MTFRVQTFLFQKGRCCDMSQNDTIGKIELNPSIVLSSDNTNCKNDIQLFHQLFDELSVPQRLPLTPPGVYERSKQWNDTSQFSSLKWTVSHAIVILLTLTCQLAPKSNSHISQSFVASVYKTNIFPCISTSTLCSNVSRYLLE